MEIKILRERAKMSSKELAEKIGISPSQMSRIESGQRRVDAQLLEKIIRALNVSPLHFFQVHEAREERALEGNEGIRGEGEPSSLLPLPDDENALILVELGKYIRSERRKKHITAEELGKRIGKNRPYILALEEGKIQPIHSEVLLKIVKVLKLDLGEILELLQKQSLQLKQQVMRLEQALSQSTRGSLEFQTPQGSVTRRTIPILKGEDQKYPNQFSPQGLPLGEVVDYLYIPQIHDEFAFALAVQDDSMVSKDYPSFYKGDLVVFSPKASVSHLDFVFVRPQEGEPVFRQVFFDPGGKIRLHPLNPMVPPMILNKKEILGWWKMVSHIHCVSEESQEEYKEEKI